MRQESRYFHLSYDSLKWQFSHYVSGKYYEDIRVLRLAMLSTLCELKYNVITESLHKESRQKHIDLAASYGYDVVEINLEAAYDELLERWNKRIARGERKETMKKERFDEIYSIYMSEKNEQATTFHTDTQSVDEVSQGILKLLR